MTSSPLPSGAREPRGVPGHASVPPTGDAVTDAAWAQFLASLAIEGVRPRTVTSDAPVAETARGWSDQGLDGSRLAQALTVAGVAPADLAAAAHVLTGGHVRMTTGVMAVAGVLQAIAFETPRMGLRDALGWILATGHPIVMPSPGGEMPPQPWETVQRAVYEFTHAGFDHDAWVYAAAGVTAAEAVFARAEGTLDAGQARAMAALRGVPLPASD